PELFRFFYHALERLISCFFHQIRIAFDFASNKRFETRSDISPHMLCLHRAPLHKTFCFLDFFAFNFIRRHNEHSYRPFFSFRSYTICAGFTAIPSCPFSTRQFGDSHVFKSSVSASASCNPVIVHCSALESSSLTLSYFN